MTRSLLRSLDDFVRSLIKTEDELLTTGNVVVAPVNAWDTRAVRRLGDAQAQAVIDALVLTVRYDGGVTRGEALALENETRDLAVARAIDAAALAASVARAQARVDAALAAASPREDPRAAKRAHTETLVASIASAITDRRVRRALLDTVVRIARGSSGDADAHEDLLAAFARALELPLPEP